MTSAQIITEGTKLLKAVLRIRKYFFRINPDPWIRIPKLQIGIWKAM